MFDICLLPNTERGPDGQRLGRITVGDFTERFPCHDACVSVDEFVTLWKSQLRSLFEGQPAVALVHDPRFAWIVYREGPQCFVQQRFSLDGCFEMIEPRQTVSEDGDRISEWSIGLQAIAEFITAEPGS
jgi:hypothetical protein